MNKEKYSLDRIDKASEVVSFAFIVGATVVALWQYIISYLAEDNRDKKERITRSIELSQFYKDNVLSKYNAISFIFKESGLLEIVDKLPKNDFDEFNIAEQNRLCSRDIRNNYEEVKQSGKFLNAIINANIIFALHLHGIEECHISEQSNGGDKPAVQRTVQIQCDRDIAVHSFMQNFISDTLNDLEYFAMFFTHKVADESVVYQSLHQTYLEIIEMLYLTISSVNEPGQPAFYSNVTDLYKVWKSRHDDQIKKMARSTQENVHKGNDAEEL